MADGKLGITLRLKGGTKVSVLRTGITIIEGANTREEALEIYRRLIELVRGASRP